MAKTIKLARVLLKCSLGSEKNPTSKLETGGTIYKIVLLIFAAAAMYGSFRAGGFAQEIFGAVDGDGVIIKFVLFAISLLLFFTGIPACINSFYLSSNLNNLLVMPFTSIQITGAKFIVAVSYEYYISIVVLAPLLAGYGISGGLGAGFWIGAVLAVILLPIVPLAYAGIISMIVMGLVGAARSKEKTTIFGAVGTVVLLFLFEIFRNASSGTSLATAEHFLNHIVTSSGYITMIFPNIPLLSKGMVNTDLVYIALSTLIVIAIVVAFFLVAKLLYLDGALNMKNTSAKHKELTEEQIKGSNKVRKPIVTLMVKELKTVFRTPAGYITCIFLPLGWPILGVVPMLASGTQRAQLMGLLEGLGGESSSLMLVFILLCVSLGVTVFVAGLNGIAVTSLSREGTGIYFMKQIPVPYKTQLMAKRNVALLMCWIGSGAYMLIANIVLCAMDKLPWWSIAFIQAVNIGGLFVLVSLAMIHDIRKPNISWESESDVVGRNRYGAIVVFAGLLLGGGVMAYLSTGISGLKVSVAAFAVAIVVVVAALGFLMDRLMIWFGDKKLRKL